jgi:hypothetical protein
VTPCVVRRELLWMARRFGATGAATFEKTTQFFHAHVVPHGSLPLPGTVLKAMGMRPSGWTSGKSDVFSALDEQPIRRQKSLKMHSTTRRRTPSTKNRYHSRRFQLPLISFERPLLGSAEVGVRPINSSCTVASCIHDQHPAT